MRTKLVLILPFITLKVFAQPVKISITDLGAKPDGQTNNAVFIQQAIDKAAAAGGGTVVIPAGRFMTGTIELKSGVELHLSDNAVLLGSYYRKDYEAFRPMALIYAKGRDHISLTGNGLVDGNGRALIKDIMKRLQEGSIDDPDWKTKRPRESTRTSLFYFEDCDQVTVKGLFLKDATSWVTHYERCRHVTIDSIRLESMAYWNNDGIDIVDCKNVRITNSLINSADDGICLKSARRNDYCDSIYVENCTIRSSANAFKTGTGSLGGFKNITVRKLKVYDTYRSAIALEAVDGGFLEQIDIRDVKATNTGNAVFIRLGHRNSDSIYSSVKQIHISDVNVEVPAGKPDAGYEMEGPLLKYPPGIIPAKDKFMSVSPWNNSGTDTTGVVVYKHNIFPASVTGLPGHIVENVSLENITITYAGDADKQLNCFPLDSFRLVTEAPKAYPEFSMFGELPAWGFYARHVKGLSMKNVTLKCLGSDYRTGLLFDDVNDLRLDKLKVQGSVILPLLLLNEVKGFVKRNLQLPGPKSLNIKFIKAG